MCTARRRRSQISGIYDKEGTNHNTKEDIQKAFINHFKNIYTATNEISWLIENLEWNPIERISSDCLITPFNEQEIRNAIFSFEDNKAPGPNDFTIEFFKKFWNIFKNDVKKVFQDFFKIQGSTRSPIKPTLSL